MATQMMAATQKVRFRTFRASLLPHKEPLLAMVTRMKREMMRTLKIRVKVKMKTMMDIHMMKL